MYIAEEYLQQIYSFNALNTLIIDNNCSFVINFLHSMVGTHGEEMLQSDIHHNH